MCTVQLKTFTRKIFYEIIPVHWGIQKLTQAINAVEKNKNKNNERKIESELKSTDSNSNKHSRE